MLKTMREYLNGRKQYLVTWFNGRPDLAETSTIPCGLGGDTRKTWWSASPLVENDQDNLEASAEGPTGGLLTIPEDTEA
jgi:hypothetical protein